MWGQGHDQGFFSLSVIEFDDRGVMSIGRSHLSGAPNTYLVSVRCALGHPVFAAPDEAQRLLRQLDALRVAFDARVYGYRIEADRFHLALRHQGTIGGSDDRLRARWQAVGGGVRTTPARIRARLASLGGLMQTLLQRFSRDWNRRHGTTGHLWAGRFRSCLLADDAALLACVAWLEDTASHGQTASATSAGRGEDPSPLALANLPLRLAPDGSLFPADDAAMGMTPPAEDTLPGLFLCFARSLSAGDLAAYGAALSAGWALGRPESLSETVARLGRSTGRGRSRQLRELDDRLGLCGVWG
jgi:putative transposase